MSLRVTAKRVAARYTQLLPQINDLRGKPQGYPQLSDENLLKQAVEKEFPHEWARHVTQGIELSNLPDFPGHSRETALSGLKWTPRQLTVGVIWREERKRDPTFCLQPNTLLDEYIPKGNKLNRK